MTDAESAFGYRQRVTAFVDVLGFSALVKQSEQDAATRERVSELIGTNRAFKAMMSAMSPGLEGAFFSDSFVISAGDPANQTFYVVREVGNLCRYLLLHGLACRGAIATGPLFHSGSFVVGPALVTAYEMEQTVSFYPRIVLDNFTLDHWSRDTSEGSSLEHCAHLIRRDRDGEAFIDIFAEDWHLNFIEWGEIVSDDTAHLGGPGDFNKIARSHLDRALVTWSSNPRVRQKYEWLSAQLGARQ